jgi:hypothetical protein
MRWESGKNKGGPLHLSIVSLKVYQLGICIYTDLFVYQDRYIQKGMQYMTRQVENFAQKGKHTLGLQPGMQHIGHQVQRFAQQGSLYIAHLPQSFAH